ncbi:PqqD family protein [Alistipes sp.]|uniref:PqqD family protein n=1 Tax=Alistipes sp. TaxID=1872444 RepID=UPI003AF1C371
MKIRREFKVREMAGEHILVMPGRCGADMTRVVALNSSSLFLWEALAGREFSAGDVAGLLTEQYEVDEKRARHDAEEWIARLEECGIVEK